MIRVQRLLEYVYEDFEQMEKDMATWGVPQFGSKKVPRGHIIYSACLPPMTEIMREHDDDRN